MTSHDPEHLTIHCESCGAEIEVEVEHEHHDQHGTNVSSLTNVESFVPWPYEILRLIVLVFAALGTVISSIFNEANRLIQVRRSRAATVRYLKDDTLDNVGEDDEDAPWGGLGLEP